MNLANIIIIGFRILNILPQHQFSRGTNPGHSVLRRPEPVSAAQLTSSQLTPPLSNGSDSHYNIDSQVIVA